MAISAIKKKFPNSTEFEIGDFLLHIGMSSFFSDHGGMMLKDK